jgi:hypothetical protein
MSPEQQRAVQLQNQYIESTAPVLQDLVKQGGLALSRYQAPDFTQYGTQGMGITQDAMTGARQLAAGQLPTAFQANMNSAIQDALTPYQQQFGNLGSRGVINSTSGKSWATSMADAAQRAAQSSYLNNLTTAANLNQSYGQTATAPLSFQTALYGAQTQPAKDFLTLGTATYQPTGQAATAAQQWQANLSAPASSTVVQRPDPFASVLGSVAGAATSAWMCFAKGTKIKTPMGLVDIENVKQGDKVCTLVGIKEVKKVLTGNEQTYTVKTNKGEIVCTETETFLTTDGSRCTDELFNGDILIHETGGAIVESITANEVQDVYEIVVPWFYANGFVIDGFDPTGGE